MRIPKFIKRSLEDNLPNNIQEIEIEHIDEVEYVPDVDFDDDKSVKRYIKGIKSIVRQSREYKRLMQFLKYKCEMNECFFLPAVKKYRDSKVQIEIHHTGFVIEDIIKIVLKKRYANNESYSQIDVADEVMLDHYKGWISLTALSSTAHELIHEENSSLFIPLHMVDFGDINKFYEEYQNYIDYETKQKFEQYKAISSVVENIHDIIPDYMDVSIIYYKQKDVELPDMDKILKILNKTDKQELEIEE